MASLEQSYDTGLKQIFEFHRYDASLLYGVNPDGD